MIPECRMLSDSEKEVLQDKITAFLSNRGVEIQHESLLRTLKKAGASADLENGIVRFPPELIEEGLKSLKTEFALAGVGEDVSFPLPRRDGGIYTCTGTGGRGILDPESGVHRPATLKDIEGWGALAGSLEHINLCAFPTPTDMPPETVDIHAFSALLRSTSKHIWIQPHTEASVPYIMELAQAAAGGEFGERPAASIIACGLTPFRFKAMDMEVLIRAADTGMPVHLSSLPVIGGTSPVSTLGTVLVSGIEILAMLIVVQILKPGLPAIGLSTSLHMDMRSGRAVKASVESMRANAASAEFVREAFGIPVHTAGFTSDMMHPGRQAQIEHSFFAFQVAASGADIIGRAGELEAAKTFSPLQLIIDNEISGMLHHMRRTGDMTEDLAAVEDVMNTLPGGTFLETDHTLNHCREAFRPELLLRHARGEVAGGSGEDLLERARIRYRELMSIPQTDRIAGAAFDDLAKIVAEADRRLAGR